MLVFDKFLWTVAVPAVLDVFGVDCLAEGVRTPPAIFAKACLVAGAKMMLIQRVSFLQLVIASRICFKKDGL